MFYLKLAWNNLRNSLSVSAPFLLASTVLYMLNCIVHIILMSPISENMKHGKILLGLGAFILILFALIMEVYSYRFLLNQRSREFGLYNMLGMNKKQVSWVSTLELILMYFVTVGVGSLLSAIFSHLFYLIFVNLVHSTNLTLQFQIGAFTLTAFIFAFIFGFLALVGLLKIGKTSPLMLFRDSEKGEKEPRGNFLLAGLSIISLSVGYYISLTSSTLTAFETIIRFFIAVIIVIVGTYLFYISFMTWYLKRRRQNKTYFYQPEHFVSTSQMIFRMKQNAVGLANITILAVMAFISIATTTALYTNTEVMTEQLFPRNSKITFDNNTLTNQDEIFQKVVLDKIDKKASDFLIYKDTMITFEISRASKIVVTKKDVMHPNIAKIGFVYLVTQDDFRSLGNKLPQLKTGQTAFYKQKGDSQLTEIELLGHHFKNVLNLKTVQFPAVANTYNPGVLVVSDKTTLDNVQETFKKITNYGFEPSITAYTDLTKEEIAKILDDKGTISDNGQFIGNIETKEDYRLGVYALSGGFLFTGFLLGFSFILGAALIIYYKQYSEGHEDQKSYKILQEVGMSKDQVKKTINSQILLVFFMPIALAVLHFCAALVMLKQMLLLFGVLDSTLIYLVSAITIGLIICLYFIIYKMTSRTYYRIIER